MRITFLGDYCVYKPVGKLFIDKEVKETFTWSDYCFVNFEAPIQSDDQIAFIKAGPVISQKEGYEQLSQYFTHASIANNHIMDYGAEGLAKTVDYFSNNNIKWIGAGWSFDQCYSPVILEEGGDRIAIFSFGEAQFGAFDKYYLRPGYAWILDPVVSLLIKNIREEVNKIIILAHAGLELYNLPLPEWRSFYRHLIDCGADLIIGSHPHLIQGKEEYKGKLIYYSIGNFFFNMDVKDSRWYDGMMLCCSIENESIIITEKFIRFSQDQIMINKSYETVNRFVQLSNFLKSEFDDQYLKRVEEIVLECWDNFYKNYYAFPLFRQNLHHLPKIIRRLVSKLFQRYLIKGSEKLILHNINVDTHRFAVARVLKKMINTY